LSAKFTIRELLLVILIAALATSWAIRGIENERLRIQLVEVQNLKHQLELATNRFANCEIEMNHFMALSNANVDSIDVLLNAHRRKSASNLRVAEIQFKIDRLLKNADDSELNLRKQNILNSDVGESSRILADLESNPLSSAKQVTLARKQLAYFKTQAQKNAK